MFRCYEVVINKLQVQIGPDGTNEEVTAKVKYDVTVKVTDDDVNFDSTEHDYVIDYM